MSVLRLSPAGHLDAEVRVPGDKSISHRALILGAFAAGRTYIGNLSPAADVESTAACLRACGGWVRSFGRGRVALDGSGPAQSLRSPLQPLDCGNSGSTMRLLAGALAGHDCTATLDGDSSLRRRPMTRVADPLRAMGAEVIVSAAGTPPLEIRGRRTLRAIEWRLSVPSAQVKSAILLAALSADGPTSVAEERPTRDHTERLLKLCGVDVQAQPGRVRLNPGPLAPFGLRVPGDLSSAAFFLGLAAARPGWRMRCSQVGLNPGRTGILDVLTAMGAQVDIAEGEPAGGVEPQGDVEVRGAELRAVTVSGDLTVRCIDELPLIALLATQAEGETVITDAAELRAKESDRIAATVAGLQSLGARCAAAPDGMVVSGPTTLRPARLDPHGDHRLAMTWAVAACLASAGRGDTEIVDVESVAVSYPSFFEELHRVIARR